LAGVDIEVIDEFPFFSFLLADNHPHLLAIPYALMTVAFSLQVFLGGGRSEMRFVESSFSRERLVRTAWGIGGIVLSLILLRELLIAVAGLTLAGVFMLVLIGVLPVSLRREEFAFAAWLFGSLAFLNTWDSPIYLALLMAAIAWVSRGDRTRVWAPRLLYTGISLGAAAILLYLPWYPSFASQAGGIVANLMFPTRIQQFVVMFGVSFIPIVVWLIWRGWGRKGRRDLIWKVGLGLPLLLLVVAILFGVSNYATVIGDPILLEGALRGLGASGSTVQEGMRAVLEEGLERRLLYSGTVLVLGLTLGVSTWLLVVAGKDSEEQKSDTVWPFAILLIGIGALLVLAPEFVYLRDLFGTRMNTVFKFYFSAWILWGLAAAYACVELWPASIRLPQVGKVVVFFPLVLGLVYPLLATWTKTSGFNPVGGRTLDGTAYLASQSTADYDAIQWINESLPEGVIAEAIGGSYSQYARVSTHTGLPTVLGWGGHEVQWRGDAEPQGSRQGDIQRLYETSSWSEAAELLDKYGIDYVYVGPLELSTYLRLNEGKFEINMDKVFDNGSVRIYSRGFAG
jgi:YYY domain-containing protein